MTEGPAARRAGAASRVNAFWFLSGEIVGWIAQIALLWVGARYVLIDDGDEIDETLRLFGWCLIGTGYLAFTAAWMHLSVRFSDHDHPLFRRLAGFPLLRWFSLIVTFASSAVATFALRGTLVDSCKIKSVVANEKWSVFPPNPVVAIFLPLSLL